jgi:DNA-binding transcriptional ArsR family regulator
MSTNASARGQRRDADELIDARLVRACSHPLRVRIMVELERAPMSPVEYQAQFGGPLETIAYHFRILAECECARIIHERPRRGAVEHIYEITKLALFSTEQFSKLPESIKGGFSASILSTFMDVAAEALLTNKLDSHETRHLTWRRLPLDEEGFENVMARLEEVFQWLPAEQMAAAERMKESGEQPLLTAVALSGFECPWPERGHDFGSENA